MSHSVTSQDLSKFPIEKIKISPDVMLYKTGLTSAYTNMIAVKTTAGIVVIDAHQYPEIAIRIRGMIEKDFNGKIAYLINTHGAFDHTGGNTVFDDVPIIGSADIKNEMERFSQISKSPQFEQFIKMEMITKPEEIRDIYPGDKREIDESIELNNNLLKSIRDNTFKVIVPDTLFKDRYILKLGSTTFQMYTNTPSYSRSDIVIYIPEEKTLVVGDILNHNRLPFFHRETDLKKWTDLFEPYIDGKFEIKHFIGTHGNPIPLDEVKAQFGYLNELTDQVKNLKSEGKTSEEAMQIISLKNLPYLNDYNPYFYGSAMNIHGLNIRNIYGQLK